MAHPRRIKPVSAGRGGASQTRGRIISAAETLFAEKGVDRVSMNEVVVASGQGNASAVNYHFGGRMGLIRAVLQKHQPGIERRRSEMLDALDGERAPTLRDLVDALVQPIAEKLDDPDGGSAYLRIMDDLFRHGSDRELELLVDTPDPARDRLLGMLRRCVPSVTHQLAVLRGMLAATQLFSTLSLVARLQEAGSLDQADRSVFVGNLVDCLTGTLGAPVSPEVRAAAMAPSPRSSS